MNIQIQNVTKQIRGVTVLDNITLEFESGNIYGLRGENGSGKTMLMRIISGLIVPSKGKVLMNGKELHKEMDFPESIGLLLETPTFINGYTGFQNLKMLADLQRKISDEEIIDALNRVGLNSEDKRKYRKYSLGMKQRLGIAAAIMGSPDLIVLDEPFNAIDADGVIQIKKEIIKEKEKGNLIIMACHDTQAFDELTNKVYQISEGRIMQNRTHEEVPELPH